MSTILALLLFNVGLIYVKYRSLLPVAVLHGLANIPSKGLFPWLQLVVMLVVLVLFRREWLPVARELLAALHAKGWKTAGLVASAVATPVAIGCKVWPDVCILLVGVGFIVAVVFAAREWKARSAM